MTKTMTAEEVEQATQRLREILEAHGLAKDHSGSAQNLVSVLAAQAARVPGLVEWQEAMLSALEKGLDYTPTAEEAVARLAATITEVINYEQEVVDLTQRAEAAESERDAARKEWDQKRQELETACKVHEATNEGMRALRERVDKLMSEAYQRDERVRLADLERDKERDLRVAVQGRESAHVSALRERVATLEAQLKSQDDEHHGHIRKSSDHLRRVEEARDTAEARVRELEAEGSRDAGLEEAAQVIEAAARKMFSIRANLHVIAAQVRALVSQPPPAPAQGVESIVRDVLTAEPDALRAAIAGLSSADKAKFQALCARLEGLTSPTPPPGLREAVGKAFAPLLDPRQLGDMLSSDPLALTALRGISGAQMDVLLTWLEQRIRAAYDATGGEARLGPTPPVGDSDAFLAMLRTPTGDCALTVETESGRRYEVGGNWLHELAEDAAKYRAAVERLSDKHGLGAATALADGYDRPARGGAIVEDYYRRGLAGARWALGLTLDTPPSGPGGGDIDNLDGESPAVEAVRLAAEAGLPVRITTRARIAPTPTPEVPPLQPATPAVVWQWRDEEGNAANVSAEGYHLHGDAEVIAGALARALAEAKRETATLKAAAEGDLKATDADRGNASLAWGCAGSLQTALRRERANRMEFARKAAESMRERAAKECEARAAFCQAKADALSVGAEQGQWLIAAGEVRHMARKIRALPLE